MSAPEVVLTGVRWSGLVASQCSRRVAYEQVDTPTPPIDEKTQALFDRGHRWERLIVAEILDELAKDGMTGEKQAALLWPPVDPIGETHVDLVADMPDGTLRIVEIKSKADPKLDEAAVLQAAGQAMLLRATGRDADAVVVIVDPSSGERRDIWIDVDEHTGEVERLWQVARDGVSVETPEDAPRAGTHPSDKPCWRCPFRETCWSGWQAPPLDEVLGLDQVARDLFNVEQELREPGEHVKALKERRDELRAQLRPFLEPGEPVDVGGVVVKMTRSESERFSYSEARKAGLSLPNSFRAFVTTSATERWKVS